MKLPFDLPALPCCRKNDTAKTILVAAAAGALAAGAVITVYEVLKSEKGKAGVAKVKSGVTTAVGKVKAKLPRKAVADDCDCDLGLEEDFCECAEAATEA